VADQRTILIADRITSLGDNVITASLLFSLHRQFPDVRFLIKAPNQFAVLYASNPAVTVLELDADVDHPSAEIVYKHRPPKFWKLSGLHRKRFLACLRTLRKPIASGRSSSILAPFYTKKIVRRKLRGTMHELAYWAEMIRPVLPEMIVPVEYDLIFGHEVKEREQGSVHVHLGNGKTNEPAHPNVLLNALNEINAIEPILRLSMSGSPEYAEIAQELFAPYKATWIGQPDLMDFVRELQSVSLVLTSDSGPAHLAAVVHAPSIVFFSKLSLEPKQWGPLSPNTICVRSREKCSTCVMRNSCSRNTESNRICGQSYDREDVIKAFQNLRIQP
jgi:ADP-heptose:LPS heptosyltransferase